MRFREHRGSLVDSLDTCVELADHAALIEHLYRSFPYPLAFENIEVQPYFTRPDLRCGWKCTYIVTLKDYGVIGFTDGPSSPAPITRRERWEAWKKRNSAWWDLLTVPLVAPLALVMLVSYRLYLALCWAFGWKPRKWLP